MKKKEDKIFYFFNRIIIYGYFIGLFNLAVCLSPYYVLDMILILPPFVSYVFPLGSFAGMVPYIFFRGILPELMIYKFNAGLRLFYYIYYSILSFAIGLQLYVIFQVIKNRTYKVYKIIIYHHLCVGFIYLIYFVYTGLVYFNIVAAVIGIYGFLLNFLAVRNLKKEASSREREMRS